LTAPLPTLTLRPVKIKVGKEIYFGVDIYGFIGSSLSCVLKMFREITAILSSMDFIYTDTKPFIPSGNGAV